MLLSNTKISVLTGIMLGACISILLILIGILVNPFSFQQALDLTQRFTLLAYVLIFITMVYIFCIVRLAKYRFFSSEDIDVHGISEESATLKTLQSQLQNTLEQWVLAVVVYAAWVIIMPSQWLSVVVLSALSFIVGRVMFIVGYHKGAKARALGFSLTFYPSVIMFVILVYAMILLLS